MESIKTQFRGTRSLSKVSWKFLPISKINKPKKTEQFIIVDCSKLKNSLTEYGNEFMQTIYQHLIKESKTELNSLLQEFTDIIDELK